MRVASLGTQSPGAGAPTPPRGPPSSIPPMLTTRLHRGEKDPDSAGRRRGDVTGSSVAVPPLTMIARRAPDV